MKKRILSLFIAVAMLCSFVPTLASASYNMEGTQKLANGEYNIFQAIVANLVEYGSNVDSEEIAFEDAMLGEFSEPVNKLIAKIPGGEDALKLINVLDASVPVFIDLNNAIEGAFAAKRRLIETTTDLFNAAKCNLLWGGDAAFDFGFSHRDSNTEYPTKQLQIMQAVLQTGTAVESIRDSVSNMIFFFDRTSRNNLFELSVQLQNLESSMFTAEQYYNLGRYGQLTKGKDPEAPPAVTPPVTVTEYRYKYYENAAGERHFCPYFAGSAYEGSSTGGTFTLKYTEWSTQRATVAKTGYFHVNQGASCTNAGCIFGSFEDEPAYVLNGAYSESNRVFLEESRVVTTGGGDNPSQIEFYGKKDGGYYVKQDDSDGCVLACIAMVSSNLKQSQVSYADVKRANDGSTYASWAKIEGRIGIKDGQAPIRLKSVANDQKIRTVGNLLKTYPNGILLWFDENDNGVPHYIVAIGYDATNNILYTNDPARSGAHNVNFDGSWITRTHFKSTDKALKNLNSAYAYVLK